MTLGGTADIREGIEEGDPVKIVMGTLQTASMFMMIGAAGSTIRAAGGKALGMVDDIAYKNLLTTAKTATTMGEAADGLSGGVQALQGVVTGNPVDILAGVANIAMVDLPPGTTKKVIGELAEEGVEKIAKEAVEEVTQEGVEKITREAGEEARGMVAREADGFIPASLPGPSRETADNSLRSFEQFRQGYDEGGMRYVVDNFENPGIHRDLINPHPDATSHCTSVALATDSIAAGGDNWVMSIDYARATSSLDQRQLLDFNLAYLEAGGVGHRSLGGDELFEEMLKRGDGSRALVFIKGADNVPGHVVNVVNVGGTVKFLDGQSGKTFNTLDELLEGRPFSDLILTDPMNGFVAPGKLPEIDILPESVGVGDLILGPKMDEARKAIGDTREGIVSGFSRKADEDTLEAIEALSPGLTTRANIDALTARLKDQTAVEDVLERLNDDDIVNLLVDNQHRFTGSTPDLFKNLPEDVTDPAIIAHYLDTWHYNGRTNYFNAAEFGTDATNKNASELRNALFDAQGSTYPPGSANPIISEAQWKARSQVVDSPTGQVWDLDDKSIPSWSDKPQPILQMHHLLQSGGDALKGIRAQLERLGVSANSAFNGVALHRDLHRYMHTKDYHQAIRQALRKVTNPQDAVAKLQQIAERVSRLNSKLGATEDAIRQEVADIAADIQKLGG